MSGERKNGKVKFFNATKGFGFVIGDDGQDYFVHKTDVLAKAELRENDRVSFLVETAKKGPKAKEVKAA